MRSLIVHNGRSGFGSNAIFEFERALVRRGDECVFRSLAKGSPAADALTDAEEFDLVVASGGDGTVTNILYALREKNVPVCIFPSGTANLLFNNLGCAPEPAAIAQACHAGKTAALDLGEIRWRDTRGEESCRGFGLMAGVGYDAKIMADARPNKRSLGEAAYFAAALENPKPERARFSITVDGTRLCQEAITCIVANTSVLQGNIELIPGCRMDDGLLDVLVPEATSSVQLLRPIFAGMFDPAGERPGFITLRGSNIQVEFSHPMPLEIDGDVIDGLVTSYEARVFPACNQIVVDEVSSYA